MAIRVLIERDIQPGQEIHVYRLLVNLRTAAMQAPGYISGETLRAVDDPWKVLVISTWNSLEDWQSWQKNPVRTAIEAEIAQHLKHPQRVTAYIFA